MDGPVLEEKISFKMLGLTFSSKLDWGSYIISIAKIASKKNCYMKFLSPEVFLLCISINLPYTHVWILLSPLGWCPYLLLRIARQATKMNMQDSWSFIAASLEHLAHHRNVASLSLFYRYYFGRCFSELAQLVPLPFFEGGLLVILIDCTIFLPPFLDTTRMSMLGRSTKIETFQKYLISASFESP